MKTTTTPASLDCYLLDWVLPAVFALLVSATIRFHSLSPMPTMARMVGNLLALGALGWLVLAMRGKTLSSSPTTNWLLLALLVSALVSVSGSGGIDYSMQRLQLYLALGLLATVVHVAYRDHARLPVAALGLAIAIGHLPFLLSAVLWIKDSGQPFWKDGFRLAHFANVRQYAEFAFFAAAGATAAGLLARRLAVPAFLLAVAGMFGLVLTGSRGAALAWVLFVLLAACFGTARLRAAIHGVLVLMVAGGTVWYLDRHGGLPSPNLFTRAAIEHVGQESFDNARLSLWRMSLQQVLAHPLFGSGPEGYWLSGCCDRRILQAHDFVLQFLMEFGLVGCGIAIALLWVAIRGLGGTARVMTLLGATPENRLLACMLAAFLAYSLIDQTMYHLVPLLHFAVLAGLLAAGIVRADAVRNAGGPPSAVPETTPVTRAN
jgi:O-antigen ligase